MLKLFFFSLDMLDPNLFLWKLSWAMEKISFYKVKNCYITGHRKLLYRGCKE